MKYHIRFQPPDILSGQEYDLRLETRKKALEFYIASLLYYFPSLKILASDVYMLSCYAETDNLDLDTDLRAISDWYYKSVESVVKKKVCGWTNDAWSGNM